MGLENFQVLCPERLHCPKNNAHFLKYRGGSPLEEKFPGNSRKLGIISSVYWEISPPGAFLPYTLGNLLFFWTVYQFTYHWNTAILLERGKSNTDQPSSDYTYGFLCHPWKQGRATCSTHKKQRNGAQQILNCTGVRTRYW
jgi:hypothetical protein